MQSPPAHPPHPHTLTPTHTHSHLYTEHRAGSRTKAQVKVQEMLVAHLESQVCILVYVCVVWVCVCVVCGVWSGYLWFFLVNW